MTTLEQQLREIEAGTCSRCGGVLTGSYCGSATGLCEDCEVENWLRWKVRGKNLSRPYLTIQYKTK